MFLLWLRVAAVLYGLASVSALPAVLGDRPNWRRICLPLAIGGWLLHFVAHVEMLAAAHRFMPAGLREAQSTLGLLIASAFLLIWLRWIFVHVTLLLAAYAALIFSLVASFFYLVQERRLKDKQTPGFLEWLPPLDTIDQIAKTALIYGFHCMTGGLLIGSLIAQEQVGPAYFLDPKVVLSFVMWVLYIVMLFVRRSTGLRGRRAVYLSSAVFVAMLCVWAANLLSSVHRFTTQ
jgi:ABC-type uncharacterized transport system permease subunit